MREENNGKSSYVIGVFSEADCPAGCMCFEPSDGGAWIAPDKGSCRPILGCAYLIQIVDRAKRGNLRFGIVLPNAPPREYFELHREMIAGLLPGVRWPRPLKAGERVAEISWTEGRQTYQYGLSLTPECLLVAAPERPEVLTKVGYQIRFTHEELAKIELAP